MGGNLTPWLRLLVPRRRHETASLVFFIFSFVFVQRDVAANFIYTGGRGLTVGVVTMQKHQLSRQAEKTAPAGRGGFM